MTSIAIILAGGTGIRMNSDLPKQFILLEGKPIIQYSIEAFQASKLFEHIVIVCHPDYFDYIPKLPETKSKQHIITGGESRNKSTENAIHYIRKLMKDKDANLFFHDAARPNISQNTILKLHTALLNYSVAVAVSKMNDTIYKVDENQEFSEIQNRNLFIKAHTPQAFQLSVIENAYQQKKQDANHEFTDDVSIIKTYLPELKIEFIMDDPWNIKLTQAEDIKVMEILLKKKNKAN